MGHRARVGLAALVVFGAAACRKPPPPAPAETTDAEAPPDHLAAHEIPEGRLKAYALVLPSESNIRIRLSDEYEIESRLTPEQLSNFVRSHVKTTKITAGAHQTTFDEAIVPAEPKRILRIEITPSLPGSTMSSLMMVHDITPPPPVPKISDEDAWRKAGRLPNGKLDPSQNY